MSVVTLSASFGAGGAVIGPAVAERLGLPFIDRAIPTQVAAELGVAAEAAEARDETAPRLLTRILTSIAPVSAEYMIGFDNPRAALLTEESFLERTQLVLRRCVGERGGVILGRAGAIVLADCPGALHVRLDGDPDRRARQAARAAGMTEEQSMQLLREVDRTRAGYVKHFYRADPADPCHYHLTLDSTRLSFEACTDLIVTAYEANR
jgi:cytidylate kinase